MLILAGRNSIQTLAAGVEHSAHFGDDFLGRFVGEAEILVDLNLMIILAGVCDNLDLAVKAGEGDIDTAGIADVCLLLVDENLIGVYAGILFRPFPFRRCEGLQTARFSAVGVAHSPNTSPTAFLQGIASKNSKEVMKYADTEGKAKICPVAAPGNAC